ncbi:MAG: hypothetical protein ACPGVB_03245 [Chitinophagales bacterium]
MELKQLQNTLLIILTLFLIHPCFAFEGMETHLQENEGLSNEVFLQGFPFEAYLELTKLTDYQALESDRQLLKEKGRDGTQFIITLGKQYLKARPIDLLNFRQTKYSIEVGGLYLKALPKIVPEPDVGFEVMGDYILKEIAGKVEQGIKDGILEADNWQTRFYVQRLEDCSYYIDIPKSDVSKLIFHVQHNNWGYIWSRVRSRYLMEFILMLLLPIVFFGFYIKKKQVN